MNQIDPAFLLAALAVLVVAIAAARQIRRGLVVLSFCGIGATFAEALEALRRRIPEGMARNREEFASLLCNARQVDREMSRPMPAPRR